VSLPAALRSLDDWVMRGGQLHGVWACPPNFDLRLLRQSYLRCKMSYRFPFWKERDMRTIREVFGTTSDKPEFVGDKHDALDDARHQAQWLINTIRRVNGIGVIPEKEATD
jgi:inhibitor of KinA sporulation pathway (predicted exonuclease)